MSNLVVRIIVAILGIPFLLWIVWMGGYPLWGMVLLLQILMLYEWLQLLSKCGISVSLTRTLFLLAALYAAFFHDSHSALLSVAILCVCLWLVSHLFYSNSNQIVEMGGGILFILYIAVPLILWPVLAEIEFVSDSIKSGALVLLLVSTWFCDSGAYFVGRSFGRHKLLVRVSPNKTIEGAIGGFVFSSLPLVLIRLFGWGEPSLVEYLLLPISVGIFGQAGDLLESLVKREAGVKDSSQLIPGHGGILDRFDSLLLSTPVFFSCLIFVS